MVKERVTSHGDADFKLSSQFNSAFVTVSAPAPPNLPQVGVLEKEEEEEERGGGGAGGVCKRDCGKAGCGGGVSEALS